MGKNKVAKSLKQRLERVFFRFGITAQNVNLRLKTVFYHTYTYKGYIMAQKKVTITIDEQLNDRWNEVAKKIKMTKSGMVEDFLKEVVPILEYEEPRDVMKHALDHIGKGVSDMGSLFHEDKKESK